MANREPMPSPGLSPWTRADRGALLFLGTCAALTLPLIFPGRMPRWVLTGTLAAVVVLFGLRALSTRTLLPRTAVDWPNLLTVLLLPLGLWASADRSLSWPVIYKIVAGFVLFYGVAGLARSRWLNLLPVTLVLLAAGLAVLVLVGTRWSPAKIPFLPSGLYAALPTLRLPWRPEGIHPNLTGSVMAMLLAPTVAIAWWGQGRRLRLLALVAAGLVGLALLLSQSRGAWIGAALALLVMPWLRYRRWGLVVIALIITAGVSLWLVGPAQLESALFPTAGAGETTVGTIRGRLELWSRALYLIQDFALTGAGLGMFEKVVLVLYPPFFTSTRGGFIHAHNVFLQMAAELGIPGLIAHLALLMGLAATLIPAARRFRLPLSPRAASEGSPPDQGTVVTLSALAVGLFGSLLVYAVHGLVEVPAVVAPRGYLLLYALFGAAAALGHHLWPATGKP